MGNNTIIKVETLSKQYCLGEVGTGTISHDLNRWWHRICGKEDPYLLVGESNDRSKKGTLSKSGRFKTSILKCNRERYWASSAKIGR